MRLRFAECRNLSLLIAIMFNKNLPYGARYRKLLGSHLFGLVIVEAFSKSAIKSVTTWIICPLRACFRLYLHPNTNTEQMYNWNLCIKIQSTFYIAAI